MDLKEAIYTRRAVREFTAEGVSESIVRDLVEAAVQAPSAVNQQPWSFCVIRDKGVLAEISREAKAYMLRTSPIGLVSHHFDQILNDPNFDIFYHAPALIVISSVADIPWAVEDCALAAENLMLAARAVRLGTCWIGFAQGLAWDSRGEGDPQASGAVQAGCPDHRRPPEIGAATCPEKRTGNPLDWLVSTRTRTARTTGLR